jgi:RNA polymerase sigma factor (TIGR02999 family)
MKPNAQLTDAMAKLGEAIQARSRRIENGDLGANSHDRRFKPPLLTTWTDPRVCVRISNPGRVALPLETTENASGAWRAGKVASEPPEADNMKDATVMLAAIEAGDSKAAEQLLVLVYDELRRLAASKIAGEAPGQTLQPTALVHEAWLRLVGDQSPSFKDREHFFRASAEAMRRILIDRARRKHTQRHGGGYQRVDFDAFDVAAPAVDDQLLAVNEALDKLALEHPVQAELVKLRYFAGLTNEEVSQVLGVSLSTAKNYWTFARAWLLNEMDGN